MSVLRSIFPNAFSKSAPKRLQFWLSVSSGIIATGLFGLIADAKLDIVAFFDSRGYLDLLERVFRLDPDVFRRAPAYLHTKGPLLLLLTVATFWWYFQYAGAVKNEADIVSRLFSKANMPSWEKLSHHELIPYFTLMTVLFIVLAASVDNLPLYGGFMLILSALDFTGNTFIRRNLSKMLDDTSLEPSRSDPGAQYILRRRQIARNYWIERPQLTRVVLMIVAILGAIYLSLGGSPFGWSFPAWVPYVLLALTIAANQITMLLWRRVRNAALAEVESHESG